MPKNKMRKTGIEVKDYAANWDVGAKVMEKHLNDSISKKYMEALREKIINANRGDTQITPDQAQRLAQTVMLATLSDMHNGNIYTLQSRPFNEALSMNEWTIMEGNFSRKILPNINQIIKNITTETKAQTKNFDQPSIAADLPSVQQKALFEFLKLEVKSNNNDVSELITKSVSLAIADEIIKPQINILKDEVKTKQFEGNAAVELDARIKAITNLNSESMKEFYKQNPDLLSSITTGINDINRQVRKIDNARPGDTLDRILEKEAKQAAAFPKSNTAMLNEISNRMPELSKKLNDLTGKIAAYDQAIINPKARETLATLKGQLAAVKMEISRDTATLNGIKANNSEMAERIQTNKIQLANLNRNVEANETKISNLTEVKPKKITIPKAFTGTAAPNQDTVNKLRNFGNERFGKPIPQTEKPAQVTPPPAAPTQAQTPVTPPPAKESRELGGVSMKRANTAQPAASKTEAVITPQPRSPASPEPEVKNQVYVTPVTPARRNVKLDKISTGKVEKTVSNVDAAPSADVKQPEIPSTPATPTTSAAATASVTEPQPAQPRQEAAAPTIEEKKPTIEASAAAPISDAPPLTPKSPTSRSRKISIEGREARRAKENAAKPDANTEFVIYSQQQRSASPDPQEKNEVFVTRKSNKVTLDKIPQGKPEIKAASAPIPDAPPLTPEVPSSTRRQGRFVPPKIDAIERRGNIITEKLESAAVAEARMLAVIRNLTELQSRDFDKISQGEIDKIHRQASEAIEASIIHNDSILNNLANTINTGITSLDQKMVAGLEAKDAAEQAAEIQPEIKIETGEAPNAPAQAGVLSAAPEKLDIEFKSTLEPTLETSTIGSVNEEKLDAITRNSEALNAELQDLLTSTLDINRPTPEQVASKLETITQRFHQLESDLSVISVDIDPTIEMGIVTLIPLHAQIRDAITKLAELEVKYAARLEEEKPAPEEEVIDIPLPDEEKEPDASINRLDDLHQQLSQLQNKMIDDIVSIKFNMESIDAAMDTTNLVSVAEKLITQKTQVSSDLSELNNLLNDLHTLSTSTSIQPLNEAEKQTLDRWQSVSGEAYQLSRETIESADNLTLAAFEALGMQIYNSVYTPPQDFKFTQEIIDAHSARINSISAALSAFESTIPGTDQQKVDRINNVRIDLEEATKGLMNHAKQLPNPNATSIQRIHEINEALQHTRVEIEANSSALQHIDLKNPADPEAEIDITIIKNAIEEFKSRIATIQTAATNYQNLMTELTSLKSSVTPEMKTETAILAEWTPEKMTALADEASGAILQGGGIVIYAFQDYSNALHVASLSPAEPYTAEELDKWKTEIQVTLTTLEDFEKTHDDPEQTGTINNIKAILMKGLDNYNKLKPTPIEDTTNKNTGETQTETNEGEETNKNEEKPSILRKLTAEQEKIPPNPYLDLPNDAFKMMADRILDSKDLKRGATLIDYFDKKIAESRDPNATNLGMREKLISDWNEKLFPLLERVDTRMKDLTHILYVLEAEKKPDNSRIKAAQAALSEITEIRDKLYGDKGVRSTIQTELDKYGLDAIKINAHAVVVVTRKEGQSAEDFQAEIKRHCNALRNEDKQTSDSFTMKDKDFSVKLASQAAVVLIPGIKELEGSYIETNLPHLLEEKNTATVYSVQSGNDFSTSEVSVHHLRADLKLNDMLTLACLQGGLGERLPNPNPATRDQRVVNLLSSYKEVPFSQKGFEKFLEVKVKRGELELPKPIAGRPRIGPTCRSMASDIYGRYAKCVRDPSNPELPAPKTLEIALQIMRDFIKSNRGSCKIPVSNTQNAEINRTVQLICEVMKRSLTSSTDRYIFEYKAVGVNNHEDYSRNIFQRDLIGAVQKSLMKIDKDFVTSLSVQNQTVKQVERNRDIQTTTFNLATTENKSRVPTPEPDEQETHQTRRPGRSSSV